MKKKMLEKEERNAIDNGEWDIYYQCGCEAECCAEDGFPIWHLSYLCKEHDPTTIKTKISHSTERL